MSRPTPSHTFTNLCQQFIDSYLSRTHLYTLMFPSTVLPFHTSLPKLCTLAHVCDPCLHGTHPVHTCIHSCAFPLVCPLLCTAGNTPTATCVHTCSRAQTHLALDFQGLGTPDLLASLCCSPPTSWTTAAVSPVASGWRAPIPSRPWMRALLNPT